jgi:hypothetical protein
MTMGLRIDPAPTCDILVAGGGPGGLPPRLPREDAPGGGASVTITIPFVVSRSGAGVSLEDRKRRDSTRPHGSRMKIRFAS